MKKIILVLTSLLITSLVFGQANSKNEFGLRIGTTLGTYHTSVLSNGSLSAELTYHRQLTKQFDLEAGITYIQHGKVYHYPFIDPIGPNVYYTKNQLQNKLGLRYRLLEEEKLTVYASAGLLSNVDIGKGIYRDNPNYGFNDRIQIGGYAAIGAQYHLNDKVSLNLEGNINAYSNRLFSNPIIQPGITLGVAIKF